MAHAYSDNPRERIAEARCHPCQQIAWTRLIELVGGIIFNPNEFPEFPQERITMGGVPIAADFSLPKDRISFCNAWGKEVASIEALAIPTEFFKD